MPVEHTAPIEYEGKILDIDPVAVERVILDKGGQKLGEKFMRRYVYDITPSDKSQWIRLRDTAGETTLTVKQITSDAIDGTHEIEIGVDDFAATNALLGMLGFNPKVLPGEQANQLLPRRCPGRDRRLATDPTIPGDRSRLQARSGQGRLPAGLHRSRPDREKHHQDLRPLRHRPQHCPRTAVLIITSGVAGRTPVVIQQVRTAVGRFLQRFSLPLAAFDFAVDNDGTWWFLEANPGGQYGWIEQHTGLHISEAIAELLVHEEAAS